MPGLRVPESSEELPLQPLGDGLPRRLTERLAALRNRIIVMAAHEALYMTKPTWRITITQHGSSFYGSSSDDKKNNVRGDELTV